MASPDTTADKRICIGKVTSAHGVKGLVKIFPYCEDLSLINGTLFTSENGPNTVEVTQKNKMGKHVLAQIKGVQTREDAQALKTTLYITRDQLPTPKDDEFYVEDLIGFQIINTQDQNSGKVIAVPDFGAGTLLEITPPSGPSYFVPLAHECVRSVNIDTQTIIIENPEDFILS